MAPSATAALFLAPGSTPVPFLDALFQTTSANGDLSIPFVMPPGVPAGTGLRVQWAIQDAASVQGVALSNAIVGVTL